MREMTTRSPCPLTVRLASCPLQSDAKHLRHTFTFRSGMLLSSLSGQRHLHVLPDDRVVTHWLRVIGKHAPAAPMLFIELTQRADVLVSAKARVSQAWHCKVICAA